MCTSDNCCCRRVGKMYVEAATPNICQTGMGHFPYADGGWEVTPLRPEQYFHPVYSAGTTGAIWQREFEFDHADDGALRIKLHSDHDGLLIIVATGSENGNASIDPFEVLVDHRPGNVSVIRHCGRILTTVSGATFPRGKPAWVWLTYTNGLVRVGFGRDVGSNEFMQAQETFARLYQGGYTRFAVGKTGNNGAFELLDVQPLRRSKWANPNLRGTGFYGE